MNLLERIKRARQIHTLRRAVKRSPSPKTFGTLAERFLALGEPERALTVAQEGLSHFPDSERLLHVRLFVKKKSLADDIRKLRRDIARRPSPLSYTQLAQIYRELGNEDEALEMAHECAERFPLNENPYLIQAEIRLSRFLRDLVAKDAVLAEQALRKVVRLNPHHVGAHLLLAQVYYLVGGAGETRRQLRAVLTTMPTAKEVQTFLQRLHVTESDPSDTTPFEELARAVEQEGAFAAAPDSFPTLHPQAPSVPSQSDARLDMENLMQDVARLGREPGVRNSILLDRDGEILADFSDAIALSRRQFAELIRSIREVADDASKRMDAGALVRAEIEGPGGSITVVRVRSLTIALLFGDPMRPDRAWELLQGFIARHLRTGKETIHA